MQTVSITEITPAELEVFIETVLQRILSTHRSQSQTETDSLLTIQQAADHLNLSVPTIYRFVSQAQIPVCKKGKRL